MRTDHGLLTTISSLVFQRAREHPNAPAILAPGRSALTFAGLGEQLREIADCLESVGVSHSTRVAIGLPNGPEMAVAFLAVAACATCAPLNPTSQASELRFYLEDLRAEVLIMREGDRGPARSLADEMGVKVLEVEVLAADQAGRFRLRPGPGKGDQMPSFSASDDVALVLYTSGTTARPKMVPLSHANLMASASNISGHVALSRAGW
jgi:acyl-CoA synthetase (AMP-forming)/AMP-acid ligase II